MDQVGPEIYAVHREPRRPPPGALSPLLLTTLVRHEVGADKTDVLTPQYGFARKAHGRGFCARRRGVLVDQPMAPRSWEQQAEQ